MADTVGEFLIKLGLDADNIDKQLNNVIGNVRSGLTNLMTGVVAPALAGLASGELVQQFADDITQVDKLSKSLGVSVEQLSAWRTAAEMAGVEADEVGEIFADFNDWMTDVKYDESGTLYDYIQNGILPSVTDANGELKNTEDYILEIADAFHNMDTAEASGIARKLGLSDLQTASWIQQGGDAIRRQLELAKEIGTYTQEDAQAASEFTRSIKILTHSVRMMLLPVFRALVPILTNVSKLFTEASKHATALIPLLSGIGVAVGVRMAGGFLAIAKSIKTAALAARAFIFSPWGALLMILLAIGLVLEDFIVWLDGGETAWGKYYEAIFGNQENAKQFFEDLYETAASVFTAIGKVIDELSPHFAKLWTSLKNLFTVFVNSTVFQGFANMVLDALGLIMDAIAYFADFLVGNSDNIAAFFNELVDGIASAVDSIAEFLDSMANEFEYVSGVIKQVIDFIIMAFNVWVDTINNGVNTAIDLFYAIQNVITTVGNIINGIFNAMASAFNSFVSAVSSGASTIIGWITNILNKLAELASNSLLGKVLGSVGGSISAFIGGGGGSTDNSSTTIHVTNYGVKGAENLTSGQWLNSFEMAGAYAT